MKSKWYCKVTPDLKTILEATCFWYEDSPLGHPAIIRLDRKYKHLRHFLYSCLVETHELNVGETVTHVPARSIIYFSSVSDRKTRAWQWQLNQYATGVDSDRVIDFGGDKPCPLPWVLLWMGAQGFDWTQGVALSREFGFLDIIPETVQRHMNYGARGVLPVVALSRDEQDVLRALIDDCQ